ncbi:hypothetical protein V2J09_000500, partial [Rumex salicifolius]
QFVVVKPSRCRGRGFSIFAGPIPLFVPSPSKSPKSSPVLRRTVVAASLASNLCFLAGCSLCCVVAKVEDSEQCNTIAICNCAWIGRGLLELNGPFDPIPFSLPNHNIFIMLLKYNNTL